MSGVREEEVKLRLYRAWGLITQSEMNRAGGQSRVAMEQLVRRFWQPIYAAVRQRARKASNVSDLTQDFFVYVLEKGVIDRFERKKGKLRTFLMGVLKNFLTDEYRRKGAVKRGGEYRIQSLEQMASLPPTIATEGKDPRNLFEQEWARVVMKRAWVRLEKEDSTEILQAYLAEPGKKGSPAYGNLAKRFGKTYQGIANELHRARQMLKRFVLEEIRDYCISESEVRDELRNFCFALQKA